MIITLISYLWKQSLNYTMLSRAVTSPAASIALQAMIQSRSTTIPKAVEYKTFDADLLRVLQNEVLTQTRLWFHWYHAVDPDYMEDLQGTFVTTALKRLSAEALLTLALVTWHFGTHTHADIPNRDLKGFTLFMSSPFDDQQTLSIIQDRFRQQTGQLPSFDIFL